jgi:S1/P1 Nuclease
MKSQLFFPAALLVNLMLVTPPLGAWGWAGHVTIGKQAVAQASPAARAALMDILAVDSAAELDRAVETACFWPDAVEDEPEWAWSDPLHYVNLPRSDGRYDRQRDCPDGLCITEGIVKYAAELGRTELDRSEQGRKRRWQAFAWLCHLVGDLHQPLHTGFRNDRGGNRVTVRYRGQKYNLHEFWDHVLVEERLASSPPGPPAVRAGDSRAWRPADVIDWTEESHALVLTAAYPPGTEIDDAFADRSWSLVQNQWHTAARRLTAILDTVLAAEDSAGCE